MKSVSRRSFLKLAGVVVLAAAGISILLGCVGSRTLIPLQFDPAVIGEDAARALDEAQLKVVYTDNEEILNNEVLAAVKRAAKKVSALKDLDVSGIVILDMSEIPDTTEGQYSTILYITFTKAML